MLVNVALFATLSVYQPDGRGGREARPFEVPTESTVEDLIGMLDLPDEPRIVFVNNRHASEDAVLREGDRLAIFPPVAGG